MRKLLLSIALLAGAFTSFGQVSFSITAPGGLAGDYAFEWAEPGTWSTPDFNVPNTNVSGTCVLTDDATPGTSTTASGHPLAYEACNAAGGAFVNAAAINGNVAVLYRGSCEFGSKALACQDAGAIAVIIINHSGDPVGMGAGADGGSVTIPVIMVSTMTGDAIVDELQNGGGVVDVFIGNKQNLYANDMGAKAGESIVSDYGGAHSAIYDGFTPGIQVYNFGSADNDVIVTATITSPGSAIDYTSTVGPTAILSGDTLSIFAGNPEDFGPWNAGIGNYPNGEYTLSYDISIDGQTDEDPVDNAQSFTFWVNDGVISLSNLDATGNVVADDYPFNAATNYQACMMFQEPNASTLGVRGMYFIPYTDTSQFELEGTEVLLYAYQWNDTWVDVTNPGFTSFNEYVTDYPVITTASYVVPSNDDNGDVAYADFGTPFVLQDNVRYLFCLESTDLANEISFGYDGTIDYDGNYGIYLQPISPVFVDDTWYTGWSGLSAPSIGLRTFDPAELGLDNTEMLEGSAYPNPANDMVTVLVGGEGAATLQVTDLAGKVAMTSDVTLVNGTTNVNIASLESGVYIFNVTLENGQTAQFNVVKN